MTLSTPAEASLLGCMPIYVLQSSAFNCDKQRRKLQRERLTIGEAVAKGGRRK